MNVLLGSNSIPSSGNFSFNESAMKTVLSSNKSRRLRTCKKKINKKKIIYNQIYNFTGLLYSLCNSPLPLLQNTVVVFFLERNSLSGNKICCHLFLKAGNVSKKGGLAFTGNKGIIFTNKSILC